MERNLRFFNALLQNMLWQYLCKYSRVHAQSSMCCFSELTHFLKINSFFKMNLTTKFVKPWVLERFMILRSRQTGRSNLWNKLRLFTVCLEMVLPSKHLASHSKWHGTILWIPEILSLKQRFLKNKLKMIRFDEQ